MYRTECTDRDITQKHILYSRKSKTNVIPGWGIEIDIAREKSKFWQCIWRKCGRKHTGIVSDIMKKAGQSIVICYEHQRRKNIVEQNIHDKVNASI